MSQSKSHAPKIVVGLILGVGCLMVAFALIGIMVAIAIPAYITFQNRAIDAEAIPRLYSITDQIDRHYQDHCEFPPALPPTSDPGACCGGERCTADPMALSAWNEAAISPPEEGSRFSYSAKEQGPSVYEVRAEADYRCGGENHMRVVEITGHQEGSRCWADVAQAVIVNEHQ